MESKKFISEKLGRLNLDLSKSFVGKTLRIYAKGNLRWKNFILFLSALALLCIWPQTTSWAAGKAGRHTTKTGQVEGKDEVQLREQWFLRGRKSPDNQPAAVHRYDAFQQAKLLPMGLGGRGVGAAKGIFSKALPPGCDWTEIGPSPNTGSSWGNVSGRITSLGLDLTNDPTGNTVYLGAAYGGLWYSTNGLSSAPTFNFISDPSRTLAVGSFGLDTSHGNTASNYIYIGTGEAENSADSYYGAGILQSQNNGGNWTLVNQAYAQQLGGNVNLFGLGFAKMLVNPSYPATVIGAASYQVAGTSGLNYGGTYGGLLVTENSGSNWYWLLPQAIWNGGFPTSCTDVVYDPTTATYYAAFASTPNVTSTAGIYECTSDPLVGSNWTPLPVPSGQAGSPFWNGSSFGGGSITSSNFNRISLSARSGNLYVFVSDQSGLPSAPSAQDTGLYQWNGSAWSAIKVPSGIFGGDQQGWYDIYVSAPSGSGSLYLGGIDVWMASSVNGINTNWTDLTNAYSSSTAHPDQHAIAFVNSSTFYIGNDGGIWSNQSGTWTDCNNNIGTIQFESVSPDLFNPGTYFGGSQDNGTEKTTGSGLTWNQIWSGDGGNTDTGNASGEYLTENFGISLQYSNNSGGSFNTVSTSITDAASDFYAPYKVIPGSSPTSVVFGGQNVWRGPGSTSAGWIPITSSPLDSNGVIQALDASTNSTYIYVSTVGSTAQVFATNNGNAGSPTWTNITGNLFSASSVRPINAVALDPVTPTTVYAGVQGFVNASGYGHVFVNSNPFGGGSWTDITGNLPDAPVNSILIDPIHDNDIYVATDVGVFYTQAVNGSSTSWTRLGSLLPDTTIFQLKMSTGCDRQIVAATHGRGAWVICPVDAACNPTPTLTPTPTPTTPPSCCTIVRTPTGAGGGLGQSLGSVAVDNARNLYYVADRNNNRIQVFQLNGTALGTIGGNSPTWGTSNEFNDPNGLAVDSQGYLYVGEYNGADVKKIEPTTGQVLATFGGGTVGNVRALFVDTNGDVYIASQGGKVWVYQTPQYANNYTTVTPSGLSDSNLNVTPSGLLKSGNTLYVSDGSSQVLKYSITTGATYSWSYQGVATNAALGPFQLAQDTAGNIYVTSFYDGRFYVYGPNFSSFIYECQPQLNDDGIGVDANGNVYLAGTYQGSTGKVYQMTHCSLVTLPAPTPEPDCCSVVNTPAGAGGGLGLSLGWVAVDNTRNLYYVADTNNNRIQVFQLNGGALGTIGGTNPTWGTSNEFNGPGAIATDSHGYLYVAEYGAGDVKKIEPATGQVLATFGSGTIGNVRTVFVDTNGDVYLTSQGGSLYVYGTPSYANDYTLAAGPINLASVGSTPSGFLKVTNGSGNSYLLVSDGGGKVWEYPITGYTVGTGTLVMTLPLGAYQMAQDNAGNIYVTSYNDGRFYVFNSALEMIYSCQPQMNDDGIGVDANGYVYLAGTYQSATGKVYQMTTCATVVQPTPTPSANCCTVAHQLTGGSGGTFNGVAGLAVDNGRNVYYVADGNNQIQKFTLGTSASAGVFGNGSMFNGLGSLFMGPDGWLYVAQYSAGNVLKVDPTGSGTVLATIGSGVIGNVRAVFVDNNATNDVYTVSQNGNLFIYQQVSPNNYTLVGGPINLTAVGSTPSGILKIGSNLLVSDGSGKVWEYALSGYSLTGSATLVMTLPLGPYQMTMGPGATGDIYVTSATDGRYYVFNSALEMIYSCQPQLNDTSIGVDDAGNVYLGGNWQGNSPQVWQMASCSPYLPKAVHGSATGSTVNVGDSPTPTPTPEAAPFLTLGPNPSRNGEPVRFQVNLEQPMKVDLTLFSLAGEELYHASLQGNTGLNTIEWDLKNTSGSPVASGLYLYRLDAGDGALFKEGRVAVLH